MKSSDRFLAVFFQSRAGISRSRIRMRYDHYKTIPSVSQMQFPSMAVCFPMGRTDQFEKSEIEKTCRWNDALSERNWSWNPSVPCNGQATAWIGQTKKPPWHPQRYCFQVAPPRNEGRLLYIIPCGKDCPGCPRAAFEKKGRRKKQKSGERFAAVPSRHLLLQVYAVSSMALRSFLKENFMFPISLISFISWAITLLSFFDMVKTPFVCWHCLLYSK